MSVELPDGSRYFVTFKDDASGKEFERLVANKFGRSMKALRSDNGREYCNHEMKQYLTTRGIEFINMAPYTPQQNGKVERDNRTIVESARIMIQARNLPLTLWAEAVYTAVYVLSRVLPSGTEKTP